jgi:hypothetical protein
LEKETVWLSQAQMVELFQTTKQNISLHIKNIYEEGELDEFSTVKDYLTVQTEGKREVQRSLKFYNWRDTRQSGPGAPGWPCYQYCQRDPPGPAGGVGRGITKANPRWLALCISNSGLSDILKRKSIKQSSVLSNSLVIWNPLLLINPTVIHY